MHSRSFSLRSSFLFLAPAALGLFFAGGALPACSDSATTTDSGASQPDGSATVVDGATPLADSGTPDASASTDASADSGMTAQGKEYCDALASHGTCPNSTPRACDETAKCIYGHVMSAQGLSVYAKCYSAPSCKGDDACANEAGIAVGGKAATDYADACLKKRTECSDAFKDDFCVPSAYASPAIGAAAAACIAKPCADVKTCLEAVAKPFDDCKKLNTPQP